MERLSSVKKSIICSMCIALCIVMPIAFHTFGSGDILCPMHIPVFICGLICGWPYGLICGLTGPIISCALTSMPTVASLPAMAVELMAYGVISGILSKFVHTGKIYIDLYISLITGIVCGRILSGIVNALIFTGGNYSIAIWVSAYVVTSLPGTIIQLILIPSLIVILTNAHMIPRRYPARNKKTAGR